MVVNSLCPRPLQPFMPVSLVISELGQAAAQSAELVLCPFAGDRHVPCSLGFLRKKATVKFGASGLWPPAEGFLGIHGKAEETDQLP